MKGFHALYIFAFALAAFFAGEAGLWGLAHVAPAAHVLLLIAIAAAILFAVKFMRGETKQTQAKYFLPRWMREGPAGIALAFALGLAAVPLFYYFRMRLFLPPPQGLGDSLQLLENIPVFARLFGYLDSFDDLLSLYLRSKSYLLLSGPGSPGLPAQTALGWPSTIAGAFYVALIWIFLKARPLRDILTGLALLVMTPALQLYFGYVENYTLVSLYMTAMLMFAMGRLKTYAEAHDDAAPLLSTAAAAGLGLLAAWALLHHVVAAYLLPPLVYLVYAQARGKGEQFRFAAFSRTALTAGIAAAILLASFWAYFLFISDNPVIFADSHVAHPPFLHPRKVFSTRHVLNLVNQFLLIAPAALLLLSGTFMRGIKTFFGGTGGVRARLVRARVVFAPDPTAAFLGIAVLSFLFQATLHNPIIGYPADWDLMTLFGIPLNLYAFHMFARAREEDEARGDGHGMHALGSAVLLLAFSSVLTTSWIMRNASGGPASRDNLVRADRLVHRATKTISESPVYKSLKNKHRRKQFVRIELFLLRSELFLRARGDGEAREIMRLLNAHRPRFARIMRLPDGEYEPAFAKLWNDLARLNQRIAKLESPL